MGKQSLNATATSKISGKTGRGTGNEKGKKNLISNYCMQQQQEKEKRRKVEGLKNEGSEDMDEGDQNNASTAHSNQNINKCDIKEVNNNEEKEIKASWSETCEKYRRGWISEPRPLEASLTRRILRNLDRKVQK